MTRSGLTGTGTSEISNDNAELEPCAPQSPISVRHRFHSGNTSPTLPQNAVPCVRDGSTVAKSPS